MEKIKLLVVDDNKNLVDMIEEYFSSNDSVVVNLKAYDGVEGLELIKDKQNEYDAIILDLIMPNKDGIYVLEEMKKLGIKSKETLRKQYLDPAIKQGLVNLTIPDKPTSKNQKYIKA